MLSVGTGALSPPRQLAAGEDLNQVFGQMAPRSTASSIPGSGYIETQSTGLGASHVSGIFSKSPLKLVSPAPTRKERAALVFALNHGGGLVAGDQMSVRIDVRDGSRLGYLTQGSTKIYRNIPGAPCSTQTLNVTIGVGAALLILPDPVQPFRDSACTQRQQFEIDQISSSLLILDWICEGRSARGEKWSFTEWQSRNEVWSAPEKRQDSGLMERRLLMRDTIKLTQQSPLGTQPIADRMGELGVFGTVLIKGALFESLSQLFLRQYACLPRVGSKQWSVASEAPSWENLEDDKPLEGAKKVIWTATSTRNFVVVRFGASTVEKARHWLREVFIHDGTVEREFGKRYLFCLQGH